MIKDEFHKSFDGISPSPELLDRISAMMSEEIGKKKPPIYMNVVKYGGIAAALALAAGGTILAMNMSGGVETAPAESGTVQAPAAVTTEEIPAVTSAPEKTYAVTTETPGTQHITTSAPVEITSDETEEIPEPDTAVIPVVPTEPVLSADTFVSPETAVVTVTEPGSANVMIYEVTEPVPVVTSVRTRQEVTTSVPGMPVATSKERPTDNGIMPAMPIEPEKVPAETTTKPVTETHTQTTTVQDTEPGVTEGSVDYADDQDIGDEGEVTSESDAAMTSMTSYDEPDDLPDIEEPGDIEPPTGETGTGVAAPVDEPEEIVEKVDLFYLPGNGDINTLPAFLTQKLRGADVTAEWLELFGTENRESYVKINGLSDYANVYTFITEFNVTREELDAMLLEEGIVDTWLTGEQLDLLCGGDLAAVTAAFVTPVTIVKGDKAYCPNWLFSHTAEEWEAAGITAEDLTAVRAFFEETPELTDEQRTAVLAAIDEFCKPAKEESGDEHDDSEKDETGDESQQGEEGENNEVRSEVNENGEDPSTGESSEEEESSGNETPADVENGEEPSENTVTGENSSENEQEQPLDEQEAPLPDETTSAEE